MRTRTNAIAAALGLLACSRHHKDAIGLADAAISNGAALADGAAVAIDPEVERVACGSRRSCTLEATMHASVATDGAELVLATLLFPSSFRQDPAQLRDEACDPRETWLLRRAASGIERIQLIAKRCSTSSMPPATITLIGPKIIRYAASDEGCGRRSWNIQGGRGPEGNTDYSAGALDIALEPFEVLRTDFRRWSGNLDEPCNGEEAIWDGRSLKGERRTFATRGSGCNPTTSHDIPRLTVADERTFIRAAWRKTSLGDCSMQVGTDSASLRVLAVGSDHLFVEVNDDHFVASGRTPDRLVIQWDDEYVGTRTMRVGIGGASSGPFAVQAAIVNGTTRRYRIDAAPLFVRVTYEDSDDGETVQQVVSSASEGGFSLITWMDATIAACAAHEEALRMDRKEVVQSPESPLYSD